jgi:hypothetical protein
MWEIRKNKDGSLDEIVGKGEVQLEQMDKDHWFVCFQDGKQRLMVTLTAETEIISLVEDDSE